MNITITRNIDVDVEKPRLREVWPKYLYRHDIYQIDKIEDIGDNMANIVLESGDVFLEVPMNSFSIMSKT